MSSTNGNAPSRQAPPAGPTTDAGRPVVTNHRLARIRASQPFFLPKPQAEPVTPIPVLDDKLQEMDLRILIEVSINSRTEQIASLRMERLVPEGQRIENRWITLKALEDLTAAVCQGASLKLGAKLGAAPRSEGEHPNKQGDGALEDVFLIERGIKP